MVIAVVDEPSLRLPCEGKRGSQSPGGQGLQTKVYKDIKKQFFRHIGGTRQPIN